MTGGLPLAERTIAAILRDAGNYRTAAVGKWHLDGGSGRHLPSKFGFDAYFGVPHGLGACPCSACFPPNRTCFTPVVGHAPCQPTWAPCVLGCVRERTDGAWRCGYDDCDPKAMVHDVGVRPSRFSAFYQLFTKLYPRRNQRLRTASPRRVHQ